MSLLNDMLKDLDNRKITHQADLSSLLPLNRDLLHKIPYSFLCIMLALVLLGLTTWTYLLKKHTANTLSASAPERMVSVIPSIPTSLEIVDAHDAGTEEKALVASPPLKKITLNTSNDEQLNEALEAMQRGEDPHAIDLLNAFLIEHPSSIEAREHLATIYISHQQLFEANQVLDEGLMSVPYNLALTILKARILVEQGHESQALTLLEPFHPDIHQFPEYYALLASIFETLGRTSEAGSLYQSLIRISPSNGQYWLGLGMALEHKKATQQAIEAYTRASQSENVPPLVRAMAESRLNILQG